eukprot:jgi/Bigna1/85720/estExt_fgenesh1_pg.C_50325
MSNMPPQWLGLLKWSLKYNDGTKNTDEVRPMANEDKKFLENVMKNLVVDENEKMRVAITALKLTDPNDNTATSGDAKGKADPKEDDPLSELEALDKEESEKGEIVRKKEETLELLDDLVLNGDNAKNYVNMGGLPPLLEIVQSKHDSLVKLACQLIASISQNNPKVQVEFLKAQGLKVLLQLFRDPRTSGDVLGKALGAVSAVVRHCKPGEEAFKKAQGIPWLLKSLDDPKRKVPARVVKKGLALIRHFLDIEEDSKSMKTLLVALGAPRVIMSYHSHNDIDVREKALELIVEIATGTDEASSKAKTALKAVDFGKKVETRMKEVIGLIREGDKEDEEMYSVEMEYLKQLDSLNLA